MEFSFQQLRRYLEVEKIKGLDWDNPFLHFDLPIPWNWEAWEGKTSPFLFHNEPFTPRNTRTPRIALETTARLMANVTTYTALHHCTHYVGLETNGGECTMILSSIAAAELNGIKGKKARNAALESYFDPYSMGAGFIDFDIDSLPDGSPVPESLLDELEDLGDKMDLPPIEVQLDKDGFKMKLLPCFNLFPFEVDA